MFSNLYALVGMLIARMQREEGQTMAEYGILIGVIAVVVVTAALLLGSNISSVFTSVAGKV